MNTGIKIFTDGRFKFFVSTTFITLWLAIWYVINIWLVLGSLTSYQLQQKISSSSTEYTVSSVVRLLNKRNQIQEKIDETTKAIQERENKLSQLYIEARLNEQNYLKIWGELLLQEPKLIETEKQSITIIQGLPRQSSYLNCYKIQAAGTDKQKPSGTNQSYQNCQDANKQWHQLQGKKTLLPLKKITIGELEAELDEWQQTLEFHLNSHQQARDYLTQLSYMSTFLFDRLATMPIQLLTLILTLSMGSLGSLIFLTQNLFDKKQPMKLIDYLFHPFLGMVMAIAIFILAKSGQLVAVNSESSDAINLNPFFVSFIAIISGVLSKQAYDKIYRTGKAFFEEGEAQARWAVNIIEVMQEKNKKATDLEPYIDQKIEVINGWLSGNKAVPEEYQTLISVWLDTEKRKIFTDLK